MESELNAILAGGAPPPDLSISYSDVHGLWGGTAVVIRGDGSAERREWPRGSAATEVFETEVDSVQLLRLVRLLVEIQAWEQRTPERMPVPDESSARLTITLAGHSNSVWEWFNDMEENDRLIRVKRMMLGMTGRE